MKNESKYVQFPLFMLRDLWNEKEKTIEKIMRFGIYCYSKKLTLNIGEVARQLMYDYYRNQSDLTGYLLEAMHTYIKN